MLPNSTYAHFSALKGLAKVPDYSNLLSQRFSNKEDERAAVLARRAQTGDYDQGATIPHQANNECARAYEIWWQS